VGRHRTEDRHGRHLSSSSRTTTPGDGAGGAARHAAPGGARAPRATGLRSRAGRVVLAVGVGAAVVAAGTGAVTASAPSATTGGAPAALVPVAATPAAPATPPPAVPDDSRADLRAEEAVAAEHRAGVRDRLAAEAAAEAARVEAERVAAEELAAREAALAEAEEAASRSAQRDPRPIAADMVAERGWSSEQFSCLEQLWTKESGWQYDADNPTSSAYGIPQALPGSKMASAGADWETNPVTQISWGLEYIDDVYGTPCSAWSHSQAVNWY